LLEPYLSLSIQIDIVRKPWQVILEKLQISLTIDESIEEKMKSNQIPIYNSTHLISTDAGGRTGMSNMNFE
jgi:hypothetical protein